MRRSLLIACAVLMVAAALPAAATVSGEEGKIAFVSDRDGNREIYVMEPDGSDQVNLTNHQATDVSPAWSPDGQQIAFVSDRAGTEAVHLMDHDGTDVEWLVAGQNPEWSADGKTIYFDIGGRIYSVSVEGGPAVLVTDPDDEVSPPEWSTDWYDRSPTVSPDGTQLAFFRHFGGGPTPASHVSRLYVIPTVGGAVTKLGDIGFGTAGADWSPDGKTIVLSRYSTLSASASIELFAVDGSGTTPVPAPEPAAFVVGPVWSPIGERIAVSAHDSGNNGDIFVVELGGGLADMLTSDKWTDGLGSWQAVNPYPVGLVDPSSGLWHLRSETGAVNSFYYGVPGDAPFMGDWDCDGTKTPGLYRRSDGYVYLRNSNTQGVADIRFFFGIPNDIPLAGDFNGDGCDTVSIYRPSEARIYVINELGSDDLGLGKAEYDYLFGVYGDKPFVGDFNGDGIDTVGLHRESTGRVYYRNSNTQGVADNDYIYGIPNDRLIADDWNGDGSDTPAVFRPGNQTHYFRFENSPGYANAQYIWGAPGWIPVAMR